MARQRSEALEAMWRERLRRSGRGGVTVAEFCEDEGISVSSFYVWRRRLRERAVRCDSPAANREAFEPALFVPVSVTPAVGELRLAVADGIVLHLPATVDERLLTTCFRAALAVTRSGENV